jgi:hypothetical protein
VNNGKQQKESGKLDSQIVTWLVDLQRLILIETLSVLSACYCIVSYAPVQTLSSNDIFTFTSLMEDFEVDK